MYTLNRFIPLIITIAILSVIYWFINAKSMHANWKSKLLNPITTFSILIVWIAIGFYNKLDYTLEVGCISFHEPIFSYDNIYYSFTAILLISVGSFISNKKHRVLVLLFELIYWVHKLLWIKGGYFIGYGGGTPYSIVMYDAIALALRLLLISQIYPVKIKPYFILLLVFIILSMKLT